MRGDDVPGEVWHVVLANLSARDASCETGGDAVVGQADLARCMRVSKSLYRQASSILYRRVQTHDLCHLLEGPNNPPIPGMISKRELCRQIRQLYIEYPRDAREAQSHITYAVRQALPRSFSLPEKTIFVKADIHRNPLYATLSLEAAVQSGGEERLLAAIASGDYRRLVALKTSTRNKDSVKSLRSAADAARHFTRPVTVTSRAMGATSLPNLKSLVINSRKLYRISSLLTPYAQSISVLDRIAPKHVCCYIDDSNNLKGPNFYRLPAATIFPGQKVTDHLGHAPSSRTKRLCVHIDPRVSCPEIKLPVLLVGRTRWLFDFTRGRHRNSDNDGDSDSNSDNDSDSDADNSKVDSDSIRDGDSDSSSSSDSNSYINSDSEVGSDAFDNLSSQSYLIKPSVYNAEYIATRALEQLDWRLESFDINLIIRTPRPMSTEEDKIRNNTTYRLRARIEHAIASIHPDLKGGPEATEARAQRRERCKIRLTFVTKFPSCKSREEV